MSKTAFAAFIKAQGEMKNAEMNKVNPHFKSKYADLSSVRSATIDALSNNGLAIVQTTENMDDNFVLRTRVVHESGDCVAESIYPLNRNLKPQQLGSELTYARRYSWAAVCGISSEEDDDGNNAQNGYGESPKQQPKKKETPQPQQWAQNLAKEVLDKLAAAKTTEMFAEIRGSGDFKRVLEYFEGENFADWATRFEGKTNKLGQELHARLQASGQGNFPGHE